MDIFLLMGIVLMGFRTTIRSKRPKGPAEFLFAQESLLTTTKKFLAHGVAKSDAVRQQAQELAAECSDSGA